MYNGSCDHIKAYKKKAGLDSYEVLYAFYVACLARDSRMRKAMDCVCMAESCHRYQRIHACLTCPYFGCHKENHMHKHAEEKGHLIAMDTNFGYVYCFKCKDYQYDADFEKIAQAQNLIASRKRVCLFPVGGEINYKWEPSEEEVGFLTKHVVNSDIMKGPRGIENLGSTCYMSVIIITLVHAPIFRDYFLSLRHKCSLSRLPEISIQSSVQVSVVPRPKPVCFVCEMAEIVQEFYCGKSEAFKPDRLLYLVWLKEPIFRDPGQHDAQEFFMKLTSYLQSHSQESIENTPSNNNWSCIFDSMFNGARYIELTCPDCKYKSTGNDTFKTIFFTPDRSSSKNDTNEDSSRPSQSFMNSIERALLETESRTCDNCDKFTEHSKKITLKKLPLVLNFHLQQADKESEKHFMSFTDVIDMTRYMTQSTTEINEDNPKNGIRVMDNKFYLFAVVVHTGTESYSGGHYTAYVKRHKTNWFYMDDHTITSATFEAVLNTKAALLFYHKEAYEYEYKHGGHEKMVV